MSKTMKKALSYVLVFAMTFAMGLPMAGVQADAAKKAKLSTSKVSLYKGKTKKVTIKNAKSSQIKSLKWTTSNKKVATVKKNTKTKATIKAIKKGSATITCKFKVKKKNYKLKVKVTVKVKATPTAKPTVKPTVKPTTAPTTIPVASIEEVNKPEAALTGDGVLYSEDFNDGVGPYITRRCNDTDQLKLSVTNAGYGNKCLLVEDRLTEGEPTDGTGIGGSWRGMQFTLESIPGVEPGNSHTVTMWVMSPKVIMDSTEREDQKKGIVLSTVHYDAAGADLEDYANHVASGFLSKRLGTLCTWYKLSYKVAAPTDGSTTCVYLETPGVTADRDLYVDSVSVKALTGKVDTEKMPSLAESYKGLLKFGIGIGKAQLGNDFVMKNVIKQFGDDASITMGNCFKPDAILRNTALTDASAATDLPASYKDAKVPNLNFADVDEVLKIVKAKNLWLRGHNLLWHSQTPKWFFCEDFDASKGFVSKDVMTGRLEWYIKSVLTHIQNAEGGDRVYAWDVCNEVIEDGTGKTRTSATSAWASVYGDATTTYIENAFKFARQYATPGVDLYINEYNEYDSQKKEGLLKVVKILQDQGTIDGIGMQMHLDNIDENKFNSLDKIESAIDDFYATGLKVQITELDMGRVGSETSVKFAAAYRKLFEMFVAKKDKLDRVILWSLDDETSWRAEKNPTLFRLNFQPKAAFWEVVNAGRKALGLEELAYTEDDYYKDMAEVE